MTHSRAALPGHGSICEHAWMRFAQHASRMHMHIHTPGESSTSMLKMFHAGRSGNHSVDGRTGPSTKHEVGKINPRQEELRLYSIASRGEYTWTFDKALLDGTQQGTSNESASGSARRQIMELPISSIIRPLGRTRENGEMWTGPGSQFDVKGGGLDRGQAVSCVKADMSAFA
eukprot:354470-Chlamydomonas_euryale.AAC.40